MQRARSRRRCRRRGTEKGGALGDKKKLPCGNREKSTKKKTEIGGGGEVVREGH